jgi:hypothetical protein
MTDLILDSLEIKNFRAFRHLKIERLERINLITGKNNVGKTCILEALWLYAHRGFPARIWEILGDRQEGPRINTKRLRVGSPEGYEASIKFLFHGRHDIREKLEPIIIGPITSNDKKLAIAIAWYEEVEDDDGDTVYKIIKPEQLSKTENPAPRFRVRVGNQPSVSYPLNRNSSSLINKSRNKDILCIFSTAGGLSTEQMGLLWDKIALSTSENDIVKALQIIATDVRGVSFRMNQEDISERERIPIVKTEGVDTPFPLRGMGEGMHRLLGIILALVNAKDGLLLIDEVDIGIHYSALPDVWKLIFEVAYRLNVQVFATTHSWDCIQAFQQAADENKEVEGLLIRLENNEGELSVTGNVSATVFDERKLAIATREHIEVR